MLSELDVLEAEEMEAFEEDLEDAEDLEEGDPEEGVGEESLELLVGASESGLLEEELEEDEFLGKVLKRAKRAARTIGRVAFPVASQVLQHFSPLLKKLAPMAGRVIGTAIGGPAGAAVGGALASAVLSESEAEESGDPAMDATYEELQHPDAVAMESEAYWASSVRSPSRADSHIVRMVTLSARMYRHSSQVRRNLPHIIRGAVALAKAFRRFPKTRWAVRVVPTIVRRSLARFARMRHVSRRTIISVMSREAARALRSRSRTQAILRRNRMMALARARSRRANGGWGGYRSRRPRHGGYRMGW